jgi:hypothetical protein
MAQMINLALDYKAQQIENTEAEIKRICDYAEYVEFEEMQNMLSQIGLKLDMNVNSYANYYYNNLNENHFFEMTTSPIDKKKISAYNVDSEFYNKYLKGTHSEKGHILDKLRNKYFTTIVKNKIKYIVSF